MENCVVLYSGGMDSTVVLHHALNSFKKITALTFNYGQKHQIEIDTASQYIQELNNTNINHVIVNLKDIGTNLTTSALTNLNINVPNIKDVLGDPQTVTYVPNRNLMFLSIAAAFAESLKAEHIFYGAARADDTSGYWDCTNEFRNLINQILSLNRRNSIKVEAPLIDFDKKQIIELGIGYRIDFNLTHTCYNPNTYSKFDFIPQACGICASCSARIAGFINAGYIDPIKYAREIPWQEYNCVSL